MTSAVEERVKTLGQRVINRHLPVLMGLMAEGGKGPEEQRERATRLVEVLHGVEVVPSLHRKGRPIPLELDEQGLRFNGQMVERVDDSALAGALADPVANLLDISPVSAGLVLKMDDLPQLRGLAGELQKRVEGPILMSTDIEALVRQRVARFEQRAFDLAESMGEELAMPMVDRADLVGQVVEGEGPWPGWREVSKTAHLQAWVQALAEVLEQTPWRQEEEAIGEMLWESLALSSRSALRHAAQQLRGMAVDGRDSRRLLEHMAEALAAKTDIDDEVGAWPAYEELAKAWKALVYREDAALGARATVADPRLSVFATPGASTGLSEPSSLPWDQPLLCWTTREAGALGDLLEGLEMALEQQRSVIGGSRVDLGSGVEGLALEKEEAQCRWVLQVPRRLPEVSDGFEEAVDAAYGTLLESFMEAFDRLDAPMKQRALQMAKGAFSGFLSSTSELWSRRMAVGSGGSTRRQFECYLRAPGEVLEWPVFVDVFDQMGDRPRVATMPRFTLPAVWEEEAEQAPLWIPVEAIGEALGQAPVRVRNVSVDLEGGVVKELGDHELSENELRSLPTLDVVRALHEGALLLTVHKINL